MASQTEPLSFTVFADRYGPAQELDARRECFTAQTVARAVSIDRRFGIVVLQPGDACLRVGSEAEDYERIRIVERSLGLIGTMHCAEDGTVTWRAVAPRGLLPEVA